MYDLVHKMTVQKSSPTVYEVAYGCFSHWFDGFANNLTFDSQHTHIRLSPARTMIDFHRVTFGPTLAYLSAAFSYAERRAVRDSEKKYLLHELASRAFVESIIRREAVKEYISELVVVFFTRMRQRYVRDLLAKENFSKEAISQSAIDSYWASNLAGVKEIGILVTFFKMLASLDQSHLSVFHCFVNLPLIMKSISFGRELSSSQLATLEESSSSRAMINYLYWLTNFLTVDRHLLEKRFCMDARSAEMNSVVFAHVMGCKQMGPAIIGHHSGGFDYLLSTGDHPNLATLYDLLVGLYLCTKQTAFLEGIESHIEAHFEKLKRTLNTLINFSRRGDQVAFVQKLLAQKHKWDAILRDVFSVDPLKSSEVVTSSIAKIDQTVFAFFYSTLQLHEAVPQALTFYMHNLLLKNSCINSSTALSKSLSKQNKQFLLSNKPNLSVVRRLGLLSIEQSHRFAALYHLLALLQYLKDANGFFEYSKHFFCSRLLADNEVTSEKSSNSSIFSPSQELAFFDLLTSEIKRVFIDNLYKPTAANFHLQRQSISQSNGELLHKQFTQSLGDFRVIFKSWAKSVKVSKDGEKPQLAADPLRICHLGIWKMASFDRCRLPLSLETSFQSVEELYSKEHQGRRLLLNTAAGRATISASFWERQGKPLNLTVSLHQLAILEQFNADDESEKAVLTLTYDQLLKGGRFLVENNAKLALLSLVYCGLLKVLDPSCSLLQFQVDDRHFYAANSELATGEQIKDLSSFEQVDFWSAESSQIVDLKTSKLMKALGIAEKDLLLEGTVKSVEDVHGNCSLAQRSQIKAYGKESSPKVAFTSSSNGSTDFAVSRLLKIEAAIMRVTKRARQFDSMMALYKATKKELFVTSRVPFPPTDELTVEEVSPVVLKLVDKKFIKRNQTGGFEYVLE